MKTYQIMILNLGSTSYKFKLFHVDEDIVEAGEKLIAEGGFENIGMEEGNCWIRTEDRHWQEKCFYKDHIEAFLFSIEYLTKNFILTSINYLDAVGYKAVHAGAITGAKVVDEEILKKMEKFSSFAPAHNPVYIRLMKEIGKIAPKLLQIACFETSFHADIPLKRVVYGVPDEWRQELAIRKYGFHGASHSYIAWKMKKEDEQAKKLISFHLGGSSSVCAIEEGKSIASSMGATPQSGVMQNNRSGDFDLFCLPALMEYMHGDWQRILKILSTQGGLLGVSGVSNDMRKIQEDAEAGNKRAKLAVDSYVDQLVGYAGMFAVWLKGVDALVFTGGIGLGSSQIRRRVCEELTFFGVKLDEKANEDGGEGKISARDSKIAVYVWKTDEERMVMRQCVHVLQKNEK